MAFDLEKFFADIFAPQPGEVVTVLYDLPHGTIQDSEAWKERRAMAERWRQQLASSADAWQVKVQPTVTYAATGGNNADLPALGRQEEREVRLIDIIDGSTILICMPQFSATAPLYGHAKKATKLRVASMPGVAPFMEASGLSADYPAISAKCQRVAAIMKRAVAAQATFSTGHECFFDLPMSKNVLIDDGILHPARAGSEDALSNLPAGEVFCVPNEASDSGTRGELPQHFGDQLAVFRVENNRIVDVQGEGPKIADLRERFSKDRGWQNIAEFAIGLNDKARVTGIVLEDEKAGFHWAYGRSDHFGGQTGVKDFLSPGNVVHQDVVYAKESPITCQKLEMIFADGQRQTLIVDGQVLLEPNESA